MASRNIDVITQFAKRFYLLNPVFKGIGQTVSTSDRKSDDLLKKPIEFERKLCFDHLPISSHKLAVVFSFVVLVAEDYRFRGYGRIRSSEVPQQNVYCGLDCFSYRR